MLIQKKRLVKIEYYKAYYSNEYTTHEEGYKLSAFSFMITQSKNLRRAVNDHYKKDKNKTIMMVYKIDDYTQRIIDIKHLAKKPLITI